MLGKKSKQNRQVRGKSGSSSASGSDKDAFKKKNAALHLKKLEDKIKYYKRVIINSNDAIIIQDFKGIVKAWNKAAMSIYGFSEKEMLGKSILKIIAPEERANALKNIKAIRHGKPAFKVRQTRMTKHNQKVFVNIIYSPVYEKEEIVEIATTEEDITELKKTDEQLKASEEKLRSIFNSVLDGILLADTKKKKFYRANKSICAMLGYSENELLNLGVKDIHPKKDLQYVFKQFEKGVKGKMDVARDIPVKRKDGSVFFADISSAPIYFDGKEYSLGVFRDVTERKNAEETLKKSENLLKSAQEIAHIGNWHYDIIRDKLSWSEEIFKIFGMDSRLHKELHFKDFFKLLHPEDVQKVKDIYFKHSKENKSYKIEYRIVLPNGAIRVVEETCKINCNNKGRAISTEGTVQDITERKKTEELYKSLFNSMLNGFAYCKMIFRKNKPVDFIYLDVNDAFSKLTGLKKVIGKKVSEIIPGIQKSNPGLFKTYGRVALTGKPEKFETYLKSLDMWFSISVYSPKRGYFVAVFDVITEKKKAEQKILSSELELKNAQKFSHVGNWSWDIKANKLEWSDGMYLIFGIDKSKFTGNLNAVIQKAIHPEDREAVIKSNIAVVKNKKLTPLAYRVIWPDKSIHYIWAEAGKLVLDKNGRPSLLQGYAQDITDRKKAEAALNQAYEDLKSLDIFKSTLLRDVSHELRTPASLIVLATSMLEQEFMKGIADTENFHKYIGILSKNSKRINEELVSIVELSRLQSLNEISKERFDLNEIVKDIIGAKLESAQAKNIKLFHSGCRAVIYANKAMTRSLFRNLLVNAIKFTDKGHVKVQCARIGKDKANLRITIADTGKGISKEGLKRIFNDFVKLDPSTEGLGLGLAICKKIADLHGWMVDVESKINSGSEFKVTIPLKRAKLLVNVHKKIKR